MAVGLLSIMHIYIQTYKILALKNNIVHYRCNFHCNINSAWNMARLKYLGVWIFMDQTFRK